MMQEYGQQAYDVAGEYGQVAWKEAKKYGGSAAVLAQEYSVVMADAVKGIPLSSLLPFFLAVISFIADHPSRLYRCYQGADIQALS